MESESWVAAEINGSLDTIERMVEVVSDELLFTLAINWQLTPARMTNKKIDLRIWFINMIYPIKIL